MFQSILLFVCLLSKFSSITSFQTNHHSNRIVSTTTTPFLTLKKPLSLITTESSCKLQMASSSSDNNNKSKKKRRRKKTQEKEIETSYNDEDDDDELPDFDLPEFDTDEKVVEKSTNNMQQLPADMELSISSSVKASASPVQSTSVKNLLRSRDRSIENTFEFDAVADPLPRPTPSSSLSSSDDDLVIPEGMSKKRAKAEARKAAAIQRGALKEEEESSIIDYIPFVKNVNEDNPVKLLEYGAWSGIFALVAWEIYINSPLFERVAPMAPVVY